MSSKGQLQAQFDITRFERISEEGLRKREGLTTKFDDPLVIRVGRHSTTTSKSDPQCFLPRILT